MVGAPEFWRRFWRASHVATNREAYQSATYHVELVVVLTKQQVPPEANCYVPQESEQAH